MYKKNYGLIMACYRGYIERFDANKFRSVSKWENNMKAIGSDKLKARTAHYESKKRQVDEFEDFIAEELRRRDIVNDKSGPLTGKGTESQVTFNRQQRSTADEEKRKAKPKSVKQIREEKEREAREHEERKKANLRTNTLKALQHNSKEKNQVATINCIDYSADLYLIAFGGVHGQIGVLDSTTMSFIGMYDAHANSEVSAIYFYKRELQMISISLEGECALWDA